MDTDVFLSVEHLHTAFSTEHGKVTALEDISFTVNKGETLAIVGESGCGKSVTAMSIMGLVRESNGTIDQGKIVLNGSDIANCDRETLQKIRGNQVSMIFQEPMTALNPVFTVGEQISEVFRIHKGLNRSQARQESLRMLELVKIPAPEKRIDEYPFQLSGGMRQRVMIAMALACEPDLLIADEPTTALDVTIQAQILKLMKDLQKKQNTAIIFITHDLGVVASVADRVMVMYAGKAVEEGLLRDIFKNPQHPYTKGLINSIPKVNDSKRTPLNTIEGTVPALKNLPKGCRFQSRCPNAVSDCVENVPENRIINTQGHTVACFRPGE